MDEKTFQEKLTEAVDARLRAIAGREEELVEAWVAQHGWKPDQCMLIRQDMADGTIRMWVERRGDFDELKRYREREPLVQALRDAANAVLFNWSRAALKAPEIKRLSEAVAAMFKLSASAAEGDESA